MGPTAENKSFNQSIDQSISELLNQRIIKYRDESSALFHVNLVFVPTATVVWYQCIISELIKGCVEIDATVDICRYVPRRPTLPRILNPVHVVFLCGRW